MVVLIVIRDIFRHLEAVFAIHAHRAPIQIYLLVSLAKHVDVVKIQIQLVHFAVTVQRELTQQTMALVFPVQEQLIHQRELVHAIFVLMDIRQIVLTQDVTHVQREPSHQEEKYVLIVLQGLTVLQVLMSVHIALAALNSIHQEIVCRVMEDFTLQMEPFAFNVTPLNILRTNLVLVYHAVQHINQTQRKLPVNYVQRERFPIIMDYVKLVQMEQ